MRADGADEQGGGSQAYGVADQVAVGRDGGGVGQQLRDLQEAEHELATTLEAAVRALARARQEANELRDQVQRLIDEAGDLIADLNPEDEELLDLDRLNAELRAEQSKLEMAEGVRPEVIDQFRERQREIAAMTAEIDDLTELQTKTTDRISTLRAKWEPTLRGVIGKVSRQFSKAFDDMGLAGELRIVEDPDFERWKLEIMVKFRNAESSRRSLRSTSPEASAR